MTPEEIYAEFVAGFPVRKFSAGLLASFIDLLVHLRVPGSGMRSLSDKRRKAWRSGRRLSAWTWASRRSSLAPARVKRSRNRSSCLGLIAYTWKARSSSVSTIGPCGTSIATAIVAGSAPVFDSNQAQSSANPAPSWAKARSPTILPPASIRQTWCAWLAQSMPANHSNASVMTPSSSRSRTAATTVSPCTGARGATSHRTSVAANLPGCGSPPGGRATG